MTSSTKLHSLCSVLMASLFAYFASVQLNDPDWYFWFPLYACACVVNMVNWAISSTTTIMHVARVSLLLGLFLFIKVVMEDFVNEIAGFWSLNLSERVVREKIGSGLVVISLILQLEASLVPEDPMRKKKRDSTKFFDYGMAILVGFSYGLPLSSLWSNKENEVLIKLFKNKMYLLATISNFPFNNYRSVLCKEKCIFITAHPRHDSHFTNINACGVVL